MARSANRNVDDPIVKLWKERIGGYNADFERWEKRAEKIVKRYRDERKTGEGAGSTDDKTRRYNILYANVQTLRPAIYGQQPVVVVERRFLDRDKVARAASIIWERAIKYEIEDSHFHRTMKKSVLDYLLVGRGVPWIRYEPKFGEAISPSPSAEDDGEDIEKDDREEDEGSGDSQEADGSEDDEQDKVHELLTERACVEYVHWRDFGHSTARTWEENDFVWRRLYMAHEEMEERFGEEIAEGVPMTHMPDRLRDGVKSTAGDDAKRAEVYEIWNKADKKVYFIADGYNHLLEDPRDDPLKLDGFWPCPEPLFSIMTNDTLVPVPEYIEYQDQAQELDDLTNRISFLQKALKVAGVYDASAKGIQRLLQEGVDNELIPVSQWAMHAEKGGLAKTIDFLPIDMVAKVLIGLYEARDKIKQDLYEITGIADVLRGQSDPRETYGAQRIKSNFGSLRLSERQADVARFARDTIRIMAEVIVEHFSDETLIDISGALYDEGLMMPNPILKLVQPPGPPQMPPGGPQMGPQPGPAPVAGQQQPFHLPMAGPPAGPAAPPNAPPGPPPGAPIQLPVNPQTGQPFTPDDIAKLPKMVPDVDLIAQALGLLRNDKLRGFRIDIETDSTVQPNADQDKQDRIEFITAVEKYLQTAAMLGTQMPDAVPMLGKLLQFGVRGFRVGRDLEATIDEFVDMAEKQAKARQNSPQQPNPEMIKAQTEQMKANAEVEAQKIEAASEAQNRELEGRNKAMEVQQKAQDTERAHQIEVANIEIKHRELDQRAQELALKRLELDRQHERDMHKINTEATLKAQDIHSRNMTPRAM